jgi:hypothetical protein
MARRNQLQFIRRRVCALWCAALALVVLGGGAPASAAHTQVSFEFFQSSLTPFGSWHVSASYGQVWIPHHQVIGWHPYAYGHWVYSDFGWTWVSTYEWGAIPYHYGTWALDPELGWVWVPGYVWAPAWVVFRSGPSYVGWAPVPPGFSVGVSFAFNDYGPDHFVFVREGDFAVADVQRVVVPVERTRVVFRDTTVVNNNLKIENNIVVNRGIDVQRVERVARAPVERAPIERVPKVAPVEHVTRDELRVDPSQMERGHVRAAAPAREERAPREQKPDAQQPRERAPEVKQPRGEPERAQPPQREPERVQPKRERAPERSQQREPQIIQPQREPERAQPPQREPERVQPKHERPRVEPERERPRVEPEREQPQVAPQPQPERPPQQQHEPAQEPRGKQRRGPPPQGGPVPEEQQPHGPMGGPEER